MNEDFFTPIRSLAHAFEPLSSMNRQFYINKNLAETNIRHQQHSDYEATTVAFRAHSYLEPIVEAYILSIDYLLEFN